MPVAACALVLALGLSSALAAMIIGAWLAAVGILFAFCGCQCCGRGAVAYSCRTFLVLAHMAAAGSFFLSFLFHRRRPTLERLPSCLVRPPALVAGGSRLVSWRHRSTRTPLVGSMVPARWPTPALHCRMYGGRGWYTGVLFSRLSHTQHAAPPPPHCASRTRTCPAPR